MTLGRIVIISGISALIYLAGAYYGVEAKQFGIKPEIVPAGMSPAEIQKNFNCCSDGNCYLKGIKCSWVVKKVKK